MIDRAVHRFRRPPAIFAALIDPGHLLDDITRLRMLLREGRHDPGTGQRILPPSRHAEVHGLEATQTERRFDLIELDRFRYDTPPQITAWTRHLAGVEQQLRLMDAAPGMLTGGTMPEYLYRRTDGVVGLLERVIETGTERLTETVLDAVLLSLAGACGRDAEAGEIPAVPPGPAPPAPGSTATLRPPAQRTPRSLMTCSPSSPGCSPCCGPKDLTPS